MVKMEQLKMRNADANRSIDDAGMVVLPPDAGIKPGNENMRIPSENVLTIRNGWDII